MISNIRLRVLALLLATLGSTAQASVVEARFGATDGLGIGLTSGDSFQFFDLVNPQPDGTNDWVEGGFTALLSISWAGTLTDASLEIFAGGWGFGGDAGVYLNNQFVGLLTNGDGDQSGQFINTAWLDTFDLSGVLSHIEPDNIIEIRTVDSGDFGSLGYIKLTLQVQDGPGDTIPEPAGIALAGLALTGAMLTSRRRRRS